jgi:hypothetical protein
LFILYRLPVLNCAGGGYGTVDGLFLLRETGIKDVCFKDSLFKDPWFKVLGSSSRLPCLKVKKRRNNFNIVTSS